MEKIKKNSKYWINKKIFLMIFYFIMIIDIIFFFSGIIFMIFNKRIWLEDISFFITGFLGFFAIVLSLWFHNDEQEQVDSMTNIVKNIERISKNNEKLLLLTAESEISKKISISRNELSIQETTTKNSKSFPKIINEQIIEEYDNNNNIKLKAKK